MEKTGPGVARGCRRYRGCRCARGNTHFVQALVRNNRGLNVLVPLHDPPAVAAAWHEPDGAAVSLVLRGTPDYGQPEVPVSARILSRCNAEHGRTLLLQIESFHVAISARPPLPIHPEFWTKLGASPRTADAIVQKNFFHYRMFYLTMSFRHIPVVSSGASSFARILAGSYRTPMHPAVRLDDWRASDPVLRKPRVKS